jgi:hypothetical protein
LLVVAVQLGFSSLLQAQHGGAYLPHRPPVNM